MPVELHMLKVRKRVKSAATLVATAEAPHGMPFAARLLAGEEDQRGSVPCRCPPRPIRPHGFCLTARQVVTMIE
jgi:hypothetical protein